MKSRAILLTGGYLGKPDAKTAHGLIRGTARFHIVGVVDKNQAGKDAGQVLDGRVRNIPVFSTVEDFKKSDPKGADYAIVGVATSGGRLPGQWTDLLLNVIRHGISIICGMHTPLADIPELKQAADEAGVEILDIRKPKPASELHFWTGDILSVKTPRIGVLGTDCAIGKRTTCRFLYETLNERGIRAEMVYTGQTGWLQGYSHGFILDATVNDFVGGEIEHAILTCVREASPDLVLVEGQSALRNPLGPSGSDFILCGHIRGIILQHAPFRGYFDDLVHLNVKLPEPEDEIALAAMYGAKTLAVTLNGEGGTERELRAYARDLAERLDIPVVLPLEDGVESLVPVIREYIKKG